MMKAVMVGIHVAIYERKGDLATIAFISCLDYLLQQARTLVVPPARRVPKPTQRVQEI